MPSSIRLSPEEAWAMVERAHTGILTSLRRDGAPISLPVWFVVLDRRVYVSGPARTKKFTRMARDPRVAFLVEAGDRWSELTAVHLSGTAHLVEDPALARRVTDALDAKYARFRTRREEMPDATRRHYDTPAAVVEIVPDDRILSWDNARLFGDRDP